MEPLLEQLAATPAWDWVAVVASVAYVVLAARGDSWCWFFAAVGTSVWAYQSWFVYRLLSDALLQLFYLVMAGVGYWQWRFGGGGEDLPVTRTTAKQHLALISIACTCGLALGTFFENTMQAAATYEDAFTTAFSVGVTFFLIRRKLENWLYWIVVDAVYVWIYGRQSAWLFAGMMVVNIAVAIYGYFSWRQEIMRTNT